MSTADQRQSLGRYGEVVAARRLVEAGMVLLERNWRCELGEIDLVLRDGPVLVVCEVKTRSSTDFGDPLEAVGRAKAERLHRLAERWQEERGVRPAEVRIDLVGVLQDGHGAARVDHVRGVG
jgi:putative endonuclease